MVTSKRAFLAIRTPFYVTSTQKIMAATAAMLYKFTVCIFI